MAAIPQALQCYEATPITPPQRAEARGSYQCIVDYTRQPFSVTWSGSLQYPILTGFPTLSETTGSEVDISPVHQSPEMSGIWRDSTAFDFGSYASIRLAAHSEFPILKLANPAELSIRLIQYEFDMLAHLAKLDLPVVEFDPQPILDGGIACGYRMKRLFKLEGAELRTRADDIKHAFSELHSAGFCHGDINPSNIMKDETGRIILIDFSFAGRLGSAVPSFFPNWIHPSGRLGISPDTEALAKYIVP